MASGGYQAMKESLVDRSIHGGWDGDTDDTWLALVASDQAANLNTHQDRADITEVSGTGYTSGGVDAGAITVTASAGTVTIDGPDVTFSNVTIAAIRGSVLYKNSGLNTTDLTLFWHDFGAQAVTAADFVVQWNASGIATLV